MEELFQRLALALAVGFAVGVERGWKSRFVEDEHRVAGLRTYALIGLLGGISGLIGRELGESAFVAVFVVFGLAWTGFKTMETLRDGDLSITGTVAGLVVFGLGAYAQSGDLALTAAAAVAAVLILAFKEAMHDWLRALTWAELRSALFILAATFIALPLLPSAPIDPFGAFNPREVWLLTVALAGASFLGYVALRVFGHKAGLYLGAFAGAMVSSTAVTWDLARRSKAGTLAQGSAAAAASLASGVMFARIAVLAALAAPAMAAAAIAPLLTASLISAAFCLVLALSMRAAGATGEATKLSSPLDLAAVARIGALLAAITVSANLMSHFFGAKSLLGFAALAGLADVDAVTLAVGKLTRDGLSHELAAQAILIAGGVDTLSKAVIAALGGRARFAGLYALSSLLALSGGAAALAFT